MDYSFIDQSLALARIEKKGIIFHKVKTVGVMHGDPPYEYTSIVRPENEANNLYGQLYLSKSGILVGMRGTHYCFYAYDFNTNKFIEGGYDDPFILISENTKIYQVDVDRIIKLMKDKKQNSPGYPNEKVLRAALKHPNPEVRDAAKRMLKVSVYNKKQDEKKEAGE